MMDPLSPPHFADLRAAAEERVALAREQTPFSDLEALAAQADRPRNLFAALTQHATRGHLSFIADVPARDPIDIATRYQGAGAAAIAVSCAHPALDGRSSVLDLLRTEVHLPVVRTDLVIDQWQLWESRAAGADAVVLTAECLTIAELMDMLILAQKLGMTSIIETHSLPQLMRVGRCVGFPHPSYSLLSINTTEPGAAVRMIDFVEDTGVLMCTGAVRSREDVKALRTAGVRILRQNPMAVPGAHSDAAFALRQLLGTSSPT